MIKEYYLFIYNFFYVQMSIKRNIRYKWRKDCDLLLIDPQFKLTTRSIPYRLIDLRNMIIIVNLHYLSQAFSLSPFF